MTEEFNFESEDDYDSFKERLDIYFREDVKSILNDDNSRYQFWSRDELVEQCLERNKFDTLNKLLDVWNVPNGDNVSIKERLAYYQLFVTKEHPR